jgi:hypothetical protein
MTPELSRKIASVLGVRAIEPDDRARVLRAADAVESWDELPDEIRALLDRLATEPTYEDLLRGGADGGRPA